MPDETNRFYDTFAPRPAQGMDDGIVAALDRIACAIRGLPEDDRGDDRENDRENDREDNCEDDREDDRGDDKVTILYATAIHPTGEAAETPFGQCLRKAGYESVHHLAELSKKDPENARQQFVGRMKKAATKIGNIPEILEHDLHRFFERAEGVARYIRGEE